MNTTYFNTGYIMDTFAIVRRKDEACTEQTSAAGEVTKPGRYIINDTILDIYDAIAECQRTGQAFTSLLDPPPRDIEACHAPRSAVEP